MGEFIAKQAGGKKSKPVTEKLKSPKAAAKKGKESRTWALGGTNKEFESLDYTKDKVSGDSEMIFQQASYMPKAESVGTLKGELKDMEVESDDDYEEKQMKILERDTKKTARASAKKT